MSENVTFEYIVDEAEEILDEADDYSEHNAYRNIRIQFYKFYLPLLIVIGVPCNILAFVVLIRRRLWLHHESYIYLAAILIVNAATLAVFIGDLCLELFDAQLVRLSISADVICKLWIWAYYAIRNTNWLYDLMLLNIYLRQQLITRSERRGCFMNLAAKCCTLLGTKVVIATFFTACALTNFWAFLVFGLNGHQDTSWYCTISYHYFTRYILALHSYWLTEFISYVILLLLLLLVVWKRTRSSMLAFSHMNDVPQDNSDAEAIAKIVVYCAAVVFVLRASLILDFISYSFDLGPFFYHKIYKVVNALHLIAVAHPLSTPIVCFAVKSRFRDDLKAIVKRCCKRCCPGTRCHRTLPPELEIDRSSVLQMNPIEVDLPVTRTAEE